MEQQKRQFFQDALKAWYQKNKRPLPWRDTLDPYHIWVSEVMLQQTKVRTVIPYYLKFIRAFSDIRQLADAETETVLKYWEGLGYYARARNLHRAARKVVHEFDGRVPGMPEPFLTLPGVGSYICAAVQSICFGHPLPVVDGNVKRVLSRLCLEDAPVNAAQSHKRFSALAADVFDPAHPGDFNQALMELGAMVCTPKQPLCGGCPVISVCRAAATDMTTLYPKRKATAKVPTRHLAIGVVCKGDLVLITQRPPEGLLGGLWEFPAGKIDGKEEPRQACLRGIEMQTGLTVSIKDHLTRIQHAYSHFKITADIFICEYSAGSVALDGPRNYRWIRLDHIADYPFHKANHKFFPVLYGYFNLS